VILNLFADSPDPQVLRQQINVSLSELTAGLADSFVGFIVSYTGPGRYNHDLGVVPMLGLVQAWQVSLPISILPAKVGDWDDQSVDIDLSGAASLNGDEEIKIMLLGKL